MNFVYNAFITVGSSGFPISQVFNTTNPQLFSLSSELTMVSGGMGFTSKRTFLIADFWHVIERVTDWGEMVYTITAGDSDEGLSVKEFANLMPKSEMERLLFLVVCNEPNFVKAVMSCYDYYKNLLKKWKIAKEKFENVGERETQNKED